MPKCFVRVLAGSVLCLAIGVWTANGASLDDTPQYTQSHVEGIHLNFPQDSPLRVLIAYVSARLNINITYDESDVDQKFTLKTPAPVPLESLLDLLVSVLKSYGLVLEQTEVRGLLRIVSAAEPASPARPRGSGERMDGGTAVTQLFVLEHVRPEHVALLVTPFVSKASGNISVAPGEQIVIVSDYPSNLKRISRVIEMIDSPEVKPVVRSVPVHHGTVEDLLEVMQAILTSESNGSRANRTVNAPAVAMTADSRTNQLIVGGMKGEVERVLNILESLDRPKQLRRLVYRLTYITPERLDHLIELVLEPGQIVDYRAVSVVDGGMLVVTATPQIHELIQGLVAEVDRVPEVEQNPVRFYRLKNVIAHDVLATIRSMEVSNNSCSGKFDTDYVRSMDADREPGIATLGSNVWPLAVTEPVTSVGKLGEGEILDSGRYVLPWCPVITADQHTNSLIIIAPPAYQRVYEQIINELDQRRPQVLIETTMVALDLSDGYEMAVEIDVRPEDNDGRLITFSLFGLSDIDLRAGHRTSLGGLGGNVAVLSADVADVVIRALAANSRGQLVSMPRILVNDNETGRVNSVELEPFEGTVVTDEAMILGKGDNAEAGTTIEVVPHISEDDYIQLQYSITLSSFTGSRGKNLPPPLQANTIESRVTIPDGHTMVVGGLNRSNWHQSVSSVPFLGDIPWIKHLFRTESNDSIDRTLFVFIRPTIMRDDQFRDLKYVSGFDMNAASIPANSPPSEPMMIEPAY